MAVYSVGISPVGKPRLRTDKQAIAGITTQTVAEFGSASDTPSSTAKLFASVIELGAASEIYTGHAKFSVTISEIRSAIDSNSAVGRFIASVSNVVSAAELSNSGLKYSASDSEVASATEVISVHVVKLSSISEIAVVQDAGTVKAKFAVSDIEVGSAIDHLSVVARWGTILHEATSATDHPSSNAKLHITIVESGSANEVPIAHAVEYSIISEAITVADLPSVKARFGVSNHEVISALDAISGVRVFARSIIESVSATEISNGVILYFIRGMTLDSSNNPMPGCIVNIFRTSDNVFVSSTTSDAGGNYSFGVTDTTTEYFLVAYWTSSHDMFGTTSHLVRAA